MTSSPIESRLLNPDEWPLWDTLFANSTAPTPFASSVYLRTLSQILGHPVSLFVIERGGGILAGAAVLARRRFGMSIVAPLPAAPYSALLFSGAALASSHPAKNTSEAIALMRALVIGLSRSFRSIDLSLPPDIEDVRPWLWSGWKAVPAYTYRVDMVTEPRLSYAVQKHVRKCERNGLLVSADWDLDTCWSLLEQTRLRQGVNIGLDRLQFATLANAMHHAGLAWMETVRHSSGTPLSSRIVTGIPGADVAFDWFAGSSPEGFTIGASPWNVVKIMDDCRTRGYRSFDFCGAQYENIARFKSEFGGQLVHGFSVASPRPTLLSVYASAYSKAGALKKRLLATKRKAPL